ncbi:tryptophan synthase subunit alpha [Candidatus Daviesbacteria bacterium]|nr:tryptophan synthase subunit alpha [Candidatus Daviesbacteria bacterium]
MNLIDKKVNELKSSGKLGIMTHVVLGYPSLEATYELVKLMDQQGVYFVEIQIPFSDPLADGPTIMQASEESLKNGTKVKDAFEIAKRLSNEVSVPLFIMAYYNNVFKYGVEKFCRDAKEAGISGLIVPDISIEEEGTEHFMQSCEENNLHHIHVLSPASTDERLEKNAQVSKGFIYCTARQGITGAKNELDPKLEGFLKRVRKFFSIPIAVGFGISKKEHLEKLSGYADIAIVGSAIIDIINQSKGNYLKEVERFLVLFRTHSASSVQA